MEINLPSEAAMPCEAAVYRKMTTDPPVCRSSYGIALRHRATSTA